ncbi:MAG: sulfite exporter TauE/SafE family protein [Chitinophagaceae bacterium]|nr:sulfite exporter TauE/SafE family protein [Chitinophagaceae bacterium]MBN8668473.1 sulfite exporter TauE/SafE family protein [Chitinophagales bacterium]
MKKTMSTEMILLVLVLGLVAGIASGLVGIGGGIVLVPALVYFLNYTQHQAQGTSLGVLTFPVVILGFLYYYQECKKNGVPIDFRVIGLLAAGFVIGGLIGSKIALRIDTVMLKKVFAVVLLYSAFKLLGWDQWLFRSVKQLF